MGLVFGFVEDILGFILQPTGDFFPGYTLSTMAGVLVYALCFYRRGSRCCASCWPTWW